LEGNRNPQGGAAEAEERAAAGRMKSPDPVPEQRRDTETADKRQSNVLIVNLAGEVSTIAACFEQACPVQESRTSPP
jgi:hypothetical protein